MNRNQKIALIVAALNMAVILLFPPFDQYSIATAKAPVFAGFNLFTTQTSTHIINTSMLSLEAFVILVNLGIAWLLLRPGSADTKTRIRVGLQNAALIFTAINLVVVLLFPPFESVFALSNSAIPTFEGFYFLFDQKPSHTIVTTLLYMEVLFILANGAALWLIFKPKREMTPEEAYELQLKMRRQGTL